MRASAASIFGAQRLRSLRVPQVQRYQGVALPKIVGAVSVLRHTVVPMTEPPSWPPMDGADWQQRIMYAELVRTRWRAGAGSPDDDEQAQQWLDSTDLTAYVGSRHHTVPRFILERWADNKGQVRVYHRIEYRHGLENITNLAVKDFYTLINDDGTKTSALESLMGQVESNAKTYLDQIFNPFGPTAPLGADAIAALGQFAAFQSIRTTRHRREQELYAEWYAKTMASGRVGDDELRGLTLVPHQNETAIMAVKSAEELTPFFMCRPLAIMSLQRPLLYICDEPVVLNAPVGEFHGPDCQLNDAEIEARTRRQLRKVKLRKRGRVQATGRIVHFSSTMPRGHGTADEILLPISPSTALLWGPLCAMPQGGPVERFKLTEDESSRFATMANDAMCAQALDWIITRPADTDFASRTFLPPAAPMRVCDGANAAADAVNESSRFRPHRLWTPDS